MSYDVQWSRAASDALADIWLRADAAQRRTVTEVAAAIDQLLQFQPAQQGESREEDRRILFAHPLVVPSAYWKSNRPCRFFMCA